MIIAVNGIHHVISRDTLQCITWDYCRTLLPDVRWQEGEVGGQFCNVKMLDGDVAIIESWSGRCFVNLDTLNIPEYLGVLDTPFKQP